MSLAVSNLAAGYGETPIIREVNCTIESGEIVGIIGKNGVGKTTLLKTIMGLLSPDQGSVLLHDEEITSMSADDIAKRGVGYVPQGRDVFSGLSVEENLLIGTSVGAGDTTLYDRVYEYFPILEERADQDAETLSGGQQQMLAIGRALVGNPDIMIVDEPSEGVQPSIVQSISDNLRQINTEIDTTILFVEQNLSVIQTLADRCYAMEKGTIVEESPRAELDNTDRLRQHLVV